MPIGGILMAQQSSVGMRAGPSAYSLDSRDDRHVDTSPSDLQPPGVDEEKEPQSLEEALTG
tara:strand:- start:39 stop:221 length:183 start_codon:yes stop_codon:yes gene_type:complete